MSRVRWFVVVTACSLVMVSCGGSEKADPQLPASSSDLDLPASWTRSKGEGELPPLTAAQVQLDGDIQVLGNAANALAAECMAAQGFRYEPTTIPVDRQHDPFGAPRLDPAKTRVEGYGYLLGGKGFEGGPQAPNDSSLDSDTYVRSLSASQRASFERAFWGTKRKGTGEGQGSTIPKRGCLPDARRTVAGKAFDRWYNSAQALADAIALASVHVDSSKAYTEAMSKWSGCMATKGFHYSSDIEAGEDASRRFGTESDEPRSVSTEEKDLATADATCRIKAKLLRTVVSLRRQYERKAMTSVESQLASWLEERPHVLEKAEAALRGHSGG